MTLDQLIVFKEISKQGTLRRAAEILKRSQPAVSTALKNLEADIEEIMKKIKAKEKVKKMKIETFRMNMEI